MIELKNVGYRYKSGNKVFEDISFNIESGEFVSIIGKNGSGKSTLARLIAALERPKNGEILINNINTKDKENVISLRKAVSMVFQNPENQIIFNTVYDDIAFSLKNLYDGEEEFHSLISNSLKKVGMEDYIYANSYELSMGQKQRIAIAGILAIGAKILIFDEPTTMLDDEGKNAIYKILKNLKNEGYTIIYITNVIDEILMSDRIILLEQGQIKKSFETVNIFDNLEEIKGLGFEIPKVIRLIIELRKIGFKMDVEDFEFENCLKKIEKESNYEKSL